MASKQFLEYTMDSYKSQSNTWPRIDFPLPNKKPSVFQQLLAALKKLLASCFRCVTCGCYPGGEANSDDEDNHGPVLMDTERRAIESLLSYLQTDGKTAPTINNQRLQWLCTLTYSDNVLLQRSAALCFADFGENMRTAVREPELEPLCALLRSKDQQVQRSAVLAAANFALTGPEKNRLALVGVGAVKPLLELLQRSDPDILCHSCACVTVLANTDQGKQALISAGAVPKLLACVQNHDVSVSKNACGALLNLTHSQANRNEIVEQGGVPILASALHHDNEDLQYYCAAAVSNLAINEKHRSMLVGLGSASVPRRLAELLTSPNERVICQVCYALRNLATDSDTQALIGRLGALPLLRDVMSRAHGETLVATLACLRNLSIYRGNEEVIVNASFLKELSHWVKQEDNKDVQAHSAVALRNLAAGDHAQLIIDNGCLDAMLEVIDQDDVEFEVLSDVSAAIAVLADHVETRARLTDSPRRFCRFVDLANSDQTEVRYNAAGVLGQLFLAGVPEEILTKNLDRIIQYLSLFVAHNDPTFVHLGLWSVLQLLKVSTAQNAIAATRLVNHIELVRRCHANDRDALFELADEAMKILTTA